MSINRIFGIRPVACLGLLLALSGCSSGGGTASAVSTGTGNGNQNNTSTGGTGGTGCAARFTPSYSDVVTFQHWNHFPIKVAFTNDVPHGSTSLKSVAETGFYQWAQGSGGVLSFTVVSDPATADLVVTFKDIGAKPVTGTILGNTERQFVLATQEIVSETMTLNYWPNMSDDEALKGFKTTSTHEFGHALGIVGHSTNSGDVMWSGTVTTVDKPLTQRDLNTIKLNYCSLF